MSNDVSLIEISSETEAYSEVEGNAKGNETMNTEVYETPCDAGNSGHINENPESQKYWIKIILKLITSWC